MIISYNNICYCIVLFYYIYSLYYRIGNVSTGNAPTPAPAPTGGIDSALGKRRWDSDLDTSTGSSSHPGRKFFLHYVK